MDVGQNALLREGRLEKSYHGLNRRDEKPIFRRITTLLEGGIHESGLKKGG